MKICVFQALHSKCETLVKPIQKLHHLVHKYFSENKPKMNRTVVPFCYQSEGFFHLFFLLFNLFFFALLWFVWHTHLSGKLISFKCWARYLLSTRWKSWGRLVKVLIKFWLYLNDTIEKLVSMPFYVRVCVCRGTKYSSLFIRQNAKIFIMWRCLRRRRRRCLSVHFVRTHANEINSKLNWMKNNVYNRVYGVN